MRDEELKALITEVWDENFKVYGVRKKWKTLRRKVRPSAGTKSPG